LLNKLHFSGSGREKSFKTDIVLLDPRLLKVLRDLRGLLLHRLCGLPPTGRSPPKVMHGIIKKMG